MPPATGPLNTVSPAGPGWHRKARGRQWCLFQAIVPDWLLPANSTCCCALPLFPPAELIIPKRWLRGSPPSPAQEDPSPCAGGRACKEQVGRDSDCTPAGSGNSCPGSGQAQGSAPALTCSPRFASAPGEWTKGESSKQRGPNTEGKGAGVAPLPSSETLAVLPPFLPRNCPVSCPGGGACQGEPPASLATLEAVVCHSA